MNRRIGGWDQEEWLNEAMKPGVSAGAWQRLPAVLQAALTWSFLKNGPNTAEDLARLHEGLCFGERGPIALAVREEPRWMAANLRRLLPGLSWIQVETAVAIFLAPMNPRAVKNRRLKVGEGGEADTWGVARKGERALRGPEVEDYQRWLPSPLPGRREFLLWLHAAKRSCDNFAKMAPQKTETSSSGPMPADFGGSAEHGRIFPVDLGAWWLQKHLFDHADGVRWGYCLWRIRGTVLSNLDTIKSCELQRGMHPNGGLMMVRPGGPGAFIGGAKHGLKDFGAMIRQALEALGRFDEDPQIGNLIYGLEREAFAGTSRSKPCNHTGTWRRVRNPS